LVATPDWDSLEDYPEIGGSAYWNVAIEARHISMVGLARTNLERFQQVPDHQSDLKRLMHKHPARESFGI
jgi:hypothetical protein